MNRENKNRSKKLCDRTGKVQDVISAVQILLAEDHPLNQEMMLLMLSKLGYKVDLAKNGQEAVEAARKKDYALILMDGSMPVMDGYEATREIRKREGEHKHTIIIAFTANTIKGDIEKCLQAGMDDYLSKPASKIQIEKMLAHWIKTEI